jgi:glycosyltransferase involved in cell wall biosynthesis
MRRVLLIAYHFPPVGGAGVQRAVKLTKYLPEFGWEPVVITGPGPAGHRWTPTDPSLAGDLPPELEVHRLSGPEPARAGGWRGRAERWLGMPPRWSAWWSAGLRSAALAVGPVDVILATISPFESAAPAAALAAELDTPWIGDLRDPWALDEMTAYPTGLHRRREGTRMRHALGSAAAIVMNTEEAARLVGSRFPELGARVRDPIPNGFDPADLIAGPAPEPDPAFRIVHSGYLHTELGGRGGVRRILDWQDREVDRGARSHVHLLAALAELAATPAPRRIELHLAGVLTRADREAVPATVTVREHGYLPHAESIRLLRSADLLFLPMHDLPAGRRATIVPGKTYEYLACGRPILAAVPDGDARDLLAASPAVRLCRPHDVGAMVRIIAEELRGAPAADVDRSPIMAPFERRRIALRMAEVLDAAAGANAASGLPRSAEVAPAEG